MATFRQLSLCRLLFERESIEYLATLASALQPASQSVRQETMVVACNTATYSFLPLFIPPPCSPSHELHFPLVAFSTRNFILPHIRAHIRAPPPFAPSLPDSRNHSSLTHLIFRWHSPESSTLARRTLPPSFSPPLILVGVEFWLLGGPCLLLRPPTTPPGPPRPPPSLWKAECSLGWKVERTLVPAGSMALAPLPM